MVSLAGAAALASALAAQHHAPSSGSRGAIAVLGLGLAASWGADLLYLPGVLVDPTRLGGFRPILGVAGAVLLTYLWAGAPTWLVRARFPSMVALCTALAAIVILASPSPGIDVWQIQEAGARALLSGRNPYALRYWNPYGPGTPFLDPSLLSPDGRFITAFPYMPLVLLLDVPGAILGDVRWTMLAALAASAFLVRALGRGSRASELAAALLLLQPQGWMVLELSWTEPLALAGVLALALAVSTERGAVDAESRPGWRIWVLPGVAAAVAISTKQYVPLLVVSLLPLVAPGSRVRASLVAAAGASAIALPFLAVDPSAFLRGVLEFQIRQPFRADALSWPAAIHAMGGPRLPPWPAFVLAAAVLLAGPRGSRTVGRALVTSAGAWIVFVAFNKQAFANYYWMGVGLLCAGVAALSSVPPEPRPRKARESR